MTDVINPEHNSSISEKQGMADRPTVRAPSRLPADITAIVSASLASLAVHTALKDHAGFEPAGMVGGAVIVFAVLMGLHILLRADNGVASPKPKRKRKKSGLLAPTDAINEIKPSDLALELTGRKLAPERTAPSHPERAAEFDVDQLQRLISELAKSTPGPKATTPDPDRIVPTTSSATERMTAANIEHAHDAQAQALARAARIMRRTEGDDRNVRPSSLSADLADALSAERMTVYLEPILQMAHERPHHYEISVRFQSATGEELPHEQLMAAARSAGLLAQVDAAVVPRAARIAQHFRQRGRDTDIFARIDPSSLPNQAFRSEMTAAAIAANGAAPILSFAQTDIRSFGRIHWDILSTLVDMGVRFAIEGVTDLDMDFDALRRRGFSFVKLDADVLLNGLPAPHGNIATTDVCRYFGSLGMALIVSHINDEATRARVLGFGILFGQGTLFGGRRAVRSDLLARKAVAA